MHKLAAYISRKKMTAKDFATSVRTDPATISRLISGKALPGIELAFRIQDITRGAVRARDWINGGTSHDRASS